MSGTQRTKFSIYLFQSRLHLCQCFCCCRFWLRFSACGPHRFRDSL